MGAGQTSERLVTGRDETDAAVKLVAKALEGAEWETRDDYPYPDGEPKCWVERGGGESGDWERFIGSPLSYAEACVVERLLEVGREATQTIRDMRRDKEARVIASGYDRGLRDAGEVSLAETLEGLSFQAQAILDVLASGFESGYGYGYEHMGDYTRDVKPLCEAIVKLATEVASPPKHVTTVGGQPIHDCSDY